MDNNLPINIFVLLVLGGIGLGGLYRAGVVLRRPRLENGGRILQGLTYLLGGLASLAIALSMILYSRGT